VEPFLPARPSFGQHKPASEPRGFKLKDAILQASLILSAPVKSGAPGPRLDEQCYRIGEATQIKCWR
jgi:hypothetical protein